MPAGPARFLLEVLSIAEDRGEAVSLLMAYTCTVHCFLCLSPSGLCQSTRTLRGPCECPGMPSQSRSAFEVPGVGRDFRLCLGRDIPILPKNPRATEREIYKARVEAPLT